jgi:AIR synthase-related protein
MTLRETVLALREASGVINKRDIQISAEKIPWVTEGPWGKEAVRLGDDCAAIPDGDGFLLLAAEGMLPDLVEKEPFAAGYFSVLVNASDIYSMGGRPLAVVDALFSRDAASAAPLLEGMNAAARDLRIPIVGGHTNAKSPYAALMVAILGRARTLLTSFDARAGDDLIVVFDLRGRPNAERLFFDATRGAPPERLRADYELLPAIAERGLSRAAKDISMGGLFGSLLMLLEGSGVGARLDVDAVPRPPEVDLVRWLLSFPSFGFVMAANPSASRAILDTFASRKLSAAVVGSFDASRTLTLTSRGQSEVAWDLTRQGLTLPR